MSRVMGEESVEENSEGSWIGEVLKDIEYLIYVLQLTIILRVL
jgi:hypothetical protein